MRADCWLEFDLFFFQSSNSREQARAVVERFAPLWKKSDGDRGLNLCCGWLCDLVTEWTGDAKQSLPLRSPTAKRWSQCTYADLRDLVELLKSEARDFGIPDLKLGILFVAWGDFSWGDGGGYDLRSDWFERHPEIYFSDHWKNLDFRKRLKADRNAYVSCSDGIAEGTSFAEFFAGQWKYLSRFLGLEAVLFRDGFLGRAIYEMVGPFGQKGPENPADGEEWMSAVLAFFKAVKEANPGCIVMLYSSARSAVGEYRVGCFDLSAVVASGSIDVWLDQTWAGAWQDWWTHEFRGWTFQLANLIAHHVMVAVGNLRRKTPCKHYFLTEIWDAWEPWDTLHQAPGKLRWGMWAFSHAAAVTPHGLDRMAGCYLGWGSNWEGRLASEEDVEFLAETLDEAVSNAEGMEEIYGPAMALNLPEMARVQATAPHLNTGDLIDDECAMLAKWGMPCLAGVDLGGDPVKCEGYLLQTPSNLSADWLSHLRKGDTAYVAIGPAGSVAPGLIADIGLKDAGEDFKFGKQRLEPSSLVPDEIPPPSAAILAPGRCLAVGSAELIARTAKTVIAARSRQAPHFFWHPSSPFVPWISYLGRGQYGSLAPFVAVGRAWHRAGRGKMAATLEPVPFHLPVAFHLWRSAGAVFVLAGNLETGITGDARTLREVEVILSKRVLRLGAGAHRLRSVLDGEVVPALHEDPEEVRFRVVIGPQESVVLKLEEAAAS